MRSTTAASAVAAPYAHVTAPLRRLVDRFALVVCEAACRGAEVPDAVRAALPEVPDLMRDRSPIEFADRVRAPVLFLIGEADSRCPLRQAMAYVDKLAARGHPHEVYRFPTGHGSYDVEETIRQQRLILSFLARHDPGVSGRSTFGAI